MAVSAGNYAGDGAGKICRAQDNGEEVALPVAEAGTKEGNSIFLERSKFLFDCYIYDTKWYVGSCRNTW